MASLYIHNIFPEDIHTHIEPFDILSLVLDSVWGSNAVLVEYTECLDFALYILSLLKNGKCWFFFLFLFLCRLLFVCFCLFLFMLLTMKGGCCYPKAYLFPWQQLRSRELPSNRKWDQFTTNGSDLLEFSFLVKNVFAVFLIFSCHTQVALDRSWSWIENIC